MPNQYLVNIEEQINNLENKLIDFLTNGQQSNNIKSIITTDEHIKLHTSLYNLLSSSNLSISQKNELQKDLIQLVKQRLISYIQKNLIPDILNRVNEDLLDHLLLQWENYKIFTNWFKKLFSYLDMNALQVQRKSITIIAYETLKQNLKNILENEIFFNIYKFFQRERDGDKVPKIKIRKAAKIYTILSYNRVEIAFIIERKEFVLRVAEENNFYKETFENLLVKNIKNDYMIKIQEMALFTVPEYVSHALTALNFEMQQILYYYPQSQGIVNDTLEEILITNMAKTLIQNEQSGLKYMVEHDNIENLKALFKLLQRGNASNSDDLAESFAKSIITIGLATIKEDITQPGFDIVKFVEDIMNYKKKIDFITKEAFENKLYYESQRSDAFKIFLKKYENFPKYLANYMDNQLTSELKGKSTDEIENLISMLIKLFQLINSKDIFVEHYTKRFAQRMINKTSLDITTEKEIITRLAHETGNKAELCKFETMFSDVELSKEYHIDYKRLFPDSPLIPLILTTGNWPKLGIQQDTTKIPESLISQTKEFEMCYKSKGPSFANRGLQWIISEGKAEVDMILPTGEKWILEVKNHMLPVLLLFNKEKTMIYDDISKLVGMKDNILESYLKELTNPKRSILKRKGESNSPFKINEEIEFNDKFTSKTKRIVMWSGKIDWRKRSNVAPIQQEDMKEIENNRGFVMDSVIVRIMKSKRVTDYNTLVEEIFKLCTMFKPDNSFIKKRIEGLIERNYIKRDENERAKFIYIP